MKKIICIFVGFIILNVCVPAQAEQTSKPAAPYTKQAYDKLFEVTNASKDTLPTIGKNTTSSESLELYIKYYIKLWGMAGYDFKKSMNKYVNDMNFNSLEIMTQPIYEYAAPEMLTYLKISELCKYKQDELVLKKYFSQETVNSFSADIAKKEAQSEQPQYWFPQGVVPCMLTDIQMRSYEVITENTLKSNFNMNSPFIQQKIKEAKEQERPLIARDLDDGKRDYQTLEKISYALNDGLSQATVGEYYGSLDEKQEAELNRILSEYGNSVLDDDLKRKLERYRQRQAYLGRKDINITNTHSQSTNATQTNIPDRTDIMRFYNGNNYYTQNSNTNTFGSIDKIINSLFGLIHY